MTSDPRGAGRASEVDRSEESTVGASHGAPGGGGEAGRCPSAVPGLALSVALTQEGGICLEVA